MAKTVVGLDIGQRTMRAVELEAPDSARPTIVRVHEVSVPEGAVVGGEVREINTVASALRRLWSEGGFTSKNVILGVGNERVIARELTMPRLASMQHIREALPFQVQDMLPVPVANAVLDFYPISETVTDQGPVVNGLLIAAVKDAVLANVKAVQAAGLIPLDVDLIPFALSRAVARGPLAGVSVAIIDVGATSTSIVVTESRVPRFVRMVPGGGDNLTHAIMARVDVPWDRAEVLKAARGTSTAPPASELERAVAESMLQATHELLGSIRNTLQYYLTMHPTNPIQGIVLTDGAARLPGIAENLSETMRMQVIGASVGTTLTVGKTAAKSNPAVIDSAIVAIGLALGSAA